MRPTRRIACLTAGLTAVILSPLTSVAENASSPGGHNRASPSSGVAPPPSPSPSPTPVTLGGRAMGTTWWVTVRAPAPGLATAVVERTIADRLEMLEQQFSTYRTRSELSQFNARPDTAWFPVSAELISVAAEARRLSELTGGAFDATIAPLLRVWGFGPQRRTGDLPSREEIQPARSSVDWRRLEIRADPPALRKTQADVEADFSSLVKGFAADAISALLTAAGHGEHLVQIGGDTRTGPTPSAQPWHVGVESADLLNSIPVAVVRLNGQALSTSGDYRNFFVVEGQRYGHILDPRTGHPVKGKLASVTVVHPSCATSSALATALFVLGAEEAWAFATQHRLACLFQVREGANLTPRLTPEFTALLRAP